METTYFESQNVKVTNVRFLYYGKTIAMSGVTQIEGKIKDPDLKGALILFIVGLLIAVTGNIGWVIVASAVVYALYVLLNPKYVIWITTSSGRVQTIVSSDRKFISLIVDALNESIVDRG